MSRPKRPKVIMPAPVAPPAPAVAAVPAPIAEVISGGDTASTESPEETRTKYRPGRRTKGGSGIGSTGTGLSV